MSNKFRLFKANPFMKIAVIGVGHLGKIHARVYKQIPSVNLIAVVDIDPVKSKAVAESFSTQALQNYKDLIGQVDAVSVATITDMHYAIAKDFLEAGIHVLVEKPLTKNVEQAKELVEIARKKNVKLQVGHSERFNPIVVELFKRNYNPLYIEAQRFSPFRFRSGDVGVVLDLMVHDIDIVCALAKSKIKKIDAVGKPVIGVHEDIANARILFESGCVANISASRIAMTPSRTAKIFTKDSYMELDYAKSEGKVYRLPDPKPNLQPGIPPEFAGLTFEEIFYSKTLQIENMPITKNEPLAMEIQSFLNSIQENTVPVVSGEQGLEVVQVAQKILDELRSH